MGLSGCCVLGWGCEVAEQARPHRDLALVRGESAHGQRSERYTCGCRVDWGHACAAGVLLVTRQQQSAALAREEGWAEYVRDFVVQGGPDSTEVKNMPYYNQWEDLDDSPIGWHITEAVDPCSTDPWLSAVGGGIY